ncbi:MAG: hypothetical protein V2A59_00795 [Candidatus Omnitrophota bacterium]
MDEVILIALVRNISIFASIVGLLAGLDLILGARITTTLKAVLDKAMVNVDKAVFSTKVRITLGLLFVIISSLMILLIISTRA